MGEAFGQTVPPLARFIRDILYRYPDGSQILKELLQNAEDAGANNIKFLYDENSYGSKKLFQENLKPFQGPAVYAYNDALFEEKDWESIQHPSQSQKSDDCLKVGRFGIGFNSVYHMTDLPWILSGDCLGIFDPSEELFLHDGRRVPGWKWHLNKEMDRKHILSLRDQFQPIHDVICALNGTGLFNSEYYNGTLFRFPLRRSPSELSSTIYTDEQVWALINGFKEELPLLPMFLNHVQSIEVLHRNTKKKVTTIQKVGISSKDIEAVSQHRQIIFEEAKTFSDINCSANARNVSTSYTFSIEIQDGSNPVSVENIIISHFIPSCDQAPKAWELRNAMKSIPWVSSAAVINASGETSKGRPFCFMPLPDTEDNVMGLPVYFNAFFGLADNRRSLKWLSSDQQKEKAALWNHALITEVLPYVYAQLLQFGVNMYGDQMYKMWPTPETVKPQWTALLQPFFTALFKLPIIQLSNSGLTWIRPVTDVFFIDNLDETCKDEKVVLSIRSWLSLAKSPFATLPIHVVNCIRQFEGCLGNARIQYTTSDIIVDAARRINDGQWKTITEEMRLNLLHYFLSIPEEVKQCVTYLQNLEVIPLLEGTYTSLVADSQRNIYITDDEVKFLLTANQNQMVDRQKLHDNDWERLLQIAKYAEDPRFNLKEIVPDDFPAYLPACLPAEWKQGVNIRWNFDTQSHPSEEWLTHLWNYLQKFKTLEKFQSLSILRTSINPEHCLMIAIPNKEDSLLFLENSFSPSVDALLQKINATTVPRGILDMHPDVVNIVQGTMINDLFNLLEKSNLSEAQKIIKTAENLIKELRALISHNISLLQDQYYPILQTLPIFEVLFPSKNSSSIVKGEYISYSGCQQYKTYYIKTATTGIPQMLVGNGFILNCSDNESAVLASRLKMTEISIEQLALGVVKNRDLYSTDIFSEVMLWVLHNVSIHALKDLIGNIPFIISDDKKYHGVNELFEQNHDTEILLHSERGFFPKGKYSKPVVLDVLRAVGLRVSINQMSANEILRVAYTVHQRKTPSGKQQLLLRLIRDKWCEIGTELNSIRTENIRIFSCASTPPEDYPSTMTWYGSEQKTYFAGTDMATTSALFLVGSQVPVVKIDNTLPVDIQNAVGIQFEENLDILLVLQHLKETIRCFKLSPVIEVSKYEAMLSKIYHWLGNAKNLTDSAITSACLSDWIWIGNGFCSPEKIVLEWKNFPNGVKPYYYNLPTFLQESKFKCDVLPCFGAICEENSTILKDILQTIACTHENINTSADIVRSDLNLSVKILRALADDPDADLSGIYVPLQNSGQESQLKFHLASDCQYSDDSSSFIDIMDDLDDIKLVHSFVDKALAEKIGVSSLSAAILNLEEFAQQESLISRIKDILKDNPLGVTVFYELIQNADDAKASNIKFILDMRTNENNRRKLFFPSYKEFQGPALWVHNNSTFTENDFNNIIQLGGATKRSASDKIGNFGLGFNCVYHLTDLPSFVSGHYLAIFDPHCHGFKNGGTKMDLSKNVRKLVTLSDQLAPYNNICECDMSYNQAGVNYPYTLFRLPLRGPELESVSQISNEVCDLHKMGSLLETFVRSSAETLLFVQHIQNVDFEYLPRNGRNQSLLIQVVKTKNEDSFGFKHTNAMLSESKQALCTPGPASIGYSMFYKIQTTVNKPPDGFYNLPDLETSSHWLIQWSFEDGSALELARTDQGRANGLNPVVAVALKAAESFAQFEKCDGEAFCYLPLGIKTNLPVHVQAPFALSSNRRHIYKDNQGDIGSIENSWNKAILSNALVTCYIKLLVTLKDLQQRNIMNPDRYDALWPDGNVIGLFHPLVTSFYERICSEDAPPLWKSYDGKWVTFPNARFLQLNNGWSEDMQIAARIIFKQVSDLNESDIALVPLPLYATGIANSSYGKIFEENVYDEDKFFEAIFFPNIKSIPSELRDNILLPVISRRYAEKKTSNISGDHFLKLCKTYECIPSSPDGKVLKKPEDLVAHGKQISQLFDEQEGRFAFGEYRNKAVQSVLISLGMEKVPLPKTLVERARSIETLVRIDPERARKRSDDIASFLIGDTVDMYTNSNISDIREVKFLFALTKPEDWLLPWYEKGPDELYLPSELLRATRDHILSACVVAPLLGGSICNGERNAEKTTEILGIKRCNPPELLLKQIETLKHSIEDVTNLENNQLRKCIAATLKKLQCCLETNENEEFNQQIVERLIRLEILVFSNRYVAYDCVCAEKIETTLQPYFHTLQGSEYMNTRSLLEQCGVRDKFACEDFKSALVKMKEEFGKTHLQPHDIQTYFSLTKELINSAKQEDIDEATVSSWNLPVPDTENVFHAPKELAFRGRESTHVTRNANIKLCNEGVTIQLMKWFGIPLFRTQLLDSSRRAFGQKEDLTTRIKNILRQYSNQDADIINEMIQNADDAGATEIHFILDTRNLPIENIICENAKLLQGPSLLVYNNKSFSEDDFEGISKLGVGSKQHDTSRTGKFGIGFNTVYHITDVPMFLSENSKLCILDPHIAYVNDTATEEAPGAIFDVSNEDFRTLSSDTLTGFISTPEINLEIGTMFRLPLRGTKMASASEIKPKQTTVEDVKNFLNLVIEEKGKNLLFLNNVRKLVISHLLENGQLEHLAKFEFILNAEDEKERVNFTNNLSNVSINLTINSKYHGLLRSEMFKKVGKNTIQETCWRVRQRLVNVAQEDPELSKRMEEEHYFSISATGGYAFPVEYDKTMKFSWFTTLPIPRAVSSIPMHINGQFLLDSGRRDLQLTDYRSHKYQWNEFVLSKVLGPLYIDILKEMKDDVVRNWTEDSASEVEEGYLRLFPKTQKYVQTSATPETIILNHVYKEVYGKNMDLLFGHRQRYLTDTFKRELFWLAPVNCIFNCLNTEDAILQSYKNNLFNLLEKVEYPIIHGDFASTVKPSLEDILKVDNTAVHLNVIQPDGVWNFLTRLNDSKLFRNQSRTSSLPADLAVTVVTVEGINAVLRYCNDMKDNWNRIPLLLTKDMVLRRFSTYQKIFKHEFHYLLPKQPNLFLCDKVQWPKLPDSFCKVMTVSSLSEHLDVELPELRTSSPVHVLSISDHVRNIWKFIDENRGIKQISHLNNWALLPVLFKLDKKKELYMLPVGKACEVFGFHNELFEILGCWFLNSNSWTMEKICIQSASEITKIVNVVANKIFKVEQLRNEEKQKLLESFVSNIEGSQINELLHKLKKIPIFVTYSCDYITIQSGKLYIACRDVIDCTGLDVTCMRMNVIIMDYNSIKKAIIVEGKKTTIAAELGIKAYSDEEFYQQFVLRTLPYFNNVAIMSQLVYIRSRVNKFSEEFFVKMKSICFITDPTDVKRSISQLFEPGIYFLEEMYPENQFLPQEFLENLEKQSRNTKSEWISFFRKHLGLKCRIEKEEFLVLVKQISEMGAQAEMTKDGFAALKRKSELAFQYLCQQQHLKEDDSLLKELRNVQFLIIEKPEKRLLKLHSACTSVASTVSFQDVAITANSRLVWTVKPLCSTKMIYGVPENLLNQVGLQEVTVDEVISNLQNVCTYLKNEKSRRNGNNPMNTKLVIKELDTVIDECLEFLQKNAGKISEIQSSTLKNIPMILVEDGKRLAGIDQVVDAPCEECPPYLYQFPKRGFLNQNRFLTFFYSIGLKSERITCVHYAQVLKQCYRKYGSQPIVHPNVLATVQRAYKNFLSYLLKPSQQSMNNEEDLYLLDENNCLRCSTSIVALKPGPECQNSPYFIWNTNCLWDLRMEIMDVMDKLKFLPENIRPMFELSYVSYSIKPTSEVCRFRRSSECLVSTHLENLLQSQDIEIIYSLVSRFKLSDLNQVPKDVFMRRLRLVNVKCLKTVVVHKTDKNNGRLHYAETRVGFVIEENEELIIYISHQHWEVKKLDTLKVLAELIGEIVPFSASSNRDRLAIYLRDLDFANPTSLQEIPNSLGISEIADPCNQVRINTPGSIVSEQLRPLLGSHGNYYYYVSEVAALKVVNRQNVFIFCEVKKLLGDDDRPSPRKEYLVDCGEKSLRRMTAMDLYKFQEPDI